VLPAGSLCVLRATKYKVLDLWSKINLYYILSTSSYNTNPAPNQGVLLGHVTYFLLKRWMKIGRHQALHRGMYMCAILIFSKHNSASISRPISGSTSTVKPRASHRKSNGQQRATPSLVVLLRRCPSREHSTCRRLGRHPGLRQGSKRPGLVVITDHLLDATPTSSSPPMPLPTAPCARSS